MVRLWSISKNTFVQTIRQPIYGILLVVAFAVLVLSLPLAGWTMSTDYHDTDQKMMENLGLSTLLVAGLLVAAFSASSALSREIEDMTALTVISKPVPRATFVLGKFAGVLAAVGVFFYLCALVFLMTVRHRVMPASADPYDVPVIVLGVSAFALALLTALAGNYFFGWPFVSSGVWAATILLSVAMTVLLVVGKGWQIVPVGHDTPEDVAIHGQLLLAIVMIFMALLVFVALAVAASTRLGQVATLAVCMGMFVLGAIHPWLFGYWQKDVLAARVLGWGVAKLTYFFQVDALSKDVAIPLGYVAMSAAYCALYTAGVLMIGMALFEGRQLEAQGGSASMPGAVALLAWSGRAAAIAAGIVALVVLSLPQFHSLVGLAQAGMAGIAGALGWMLFSAFGTGRKWAYWTTWTLAALVAIAAAVAVALPGQLGVGPVFQRGAAATALAVAVVVNLVMVMPKTRSHFR